jgi:hypothetical protein
MNSIIIIYKIDPVIHCECEMASFYYEILHARGVEVSLV